MYSLLRAFFKRSHLSFHVVHPFGRFVVIFRSHTLLQNVLASFTPCCLYVFAHSPLLVGRIFLSLFWSFPFCVYCLVLSTYLFSPTSFSSFFCLVFSSFIFRSSCHSFFSFVRIYLNVPFLFFFFFLSVILFWVPTLALTFCLWSSQGRRFFSD